MPIHDWTRVSAGTFHHFHGAWIQLLSHVLNHGILPEGFYALAEQVAGGMIPDVLTLQAVDNDPSGNGGSPGGGGTAVAESPPKVSISVELERRLYSIKAN